MFQISKFTNAYFLTLHVLSNSFNVTCDSIVVSDKLFFISKKSFNRLSCWAK
jgi:hypothetical protein